MCWRETKMLLQQCSGFDVFGQTVHKGHSRSKQWVSKTLKVQSMRRTGCGWKRLCTTCRMFNFKKYFGFTLFFLVMLCYDLVITKYQVTDSKLEWDTWPKTIFVLKFFQDKRMKKTNNLEKTCYLSKVRQNGKKLPNKTEGLKTQAEHHQGLWGSWK